MNIIYQVCSFEQAEELKNLGIKQYSYFYWYDEGDKQHTFTIFAGNLPFRKDSRRCYSAYTVAELGEMLPHSIVRDEVGYYLIYTKLIDELTSDLINFCTYENDNMQDKKGHIYTSSLCTTGGTNEAEARAKMVIYLIKEGLIDIK